MLKKEKQTTIIIDVHAPHPFFGVEIYKTVRASSRYSTAYRQLYNRLLKLLRIVDLIFCVFCSGFASIWATSFKRHVYGRIF